MKGYWRDTVQRRGGTWEPAGEGPNLVVATASVVMAALLRQSTLYWAIGDGNVGNASATPAWDAGVAAQTIVPSAGETGLLREIFRKVVAPADIEFLDGGGLVVAGPTNRLRVKVTIGNLEPGSGTFYFREWGLFGLTATATPGSGFLINHKVHPTFEKTVVSALGRVVHLTL